jgi:carboxyl-terminal processing protease
MRPSRPRLRPVTERPPDDGTAAPTRTPTRTRLGGVLLLLLVLAVGIGIGRGSGAFITAGASPEIATPSDAPADFGLFWQAYEYLKQNFVDQSKLTDQALTQGAIRGMVDALGDTGHSVYLTADEVKAEADAQSGHISGIGVVVDSRSGTPLVVSVIDGAPASRAGMRAGDLILSVDGTATNRQTVQQIVQEVRGPAGTTVKLRVRHRDGTEADLTIERADIKVPTVTSAFVPGTHIAVVRLAQFSSGAGDDVKAAVQAALDEGATGMVLDLRGNPGGRVDEAVKVASTFLADGVIYQDEDRAGSIRKVNVTPGAIAPDIPLVVLVDYGSASSAEIVTGALQDNQRAQVVGVRTFGTGTVLNVFPLSDGSAIRLGVQEWLTPNGDRIFATGITPDINVELPATSVAVEPGALKGQTHKQFLANGDTQLQKAVKLLQNPQVSPGVAASPSPPG